jgi:hypothetical protein
MAMFFIALMSCNSTVQQSQQLNLPQSKSKVGIGLIHFNLNQAIPLYKSEHDTVAYDTLQFVEVKAGTNKGKCNFKTTTLGNQLNPYTLSEGDSENEGREHTQMGLIRFAPELIFTVVSQTKAGVTVIINEATAATSFIRIDPKNDLRINTNSDPQFFDPNFVDPKTPYWFYYETWEQALKRAWSIGYNKNEVYDKPNGQKLKTEIEFSQIDSVQGNWARLGERYPTDSKTKNGGWVKWQENDSIKISIMLNGGYE